MLLWETPWPKCPTCLFLILVTSTSWVFSQFSSLCTSRVTTRTSPLAFANGISFLLATQSKHQVSGKCLCRFKLTCKIIFAFLVLKPHAVKLSLSLSTLEEMKQLFQTFLDPVSNTEYHQCYRDTKLQLFLPLLLCRGCGQVKHQLGSFLLIDVSFSLRHGISHIMASIPLERQVHHS